MTGTPIAQSLLMFGISQLRDTIEAQEVRNTNSIRFVRVFPSAGTKELENRCVKRRKPQVMKNVCALAEALALEQVIAEVFVADGATDARWRDCSERKSRVQNFLPAQGFQLCAKDLTVVLQSDIIRETRAIMQANADVSFLRRLPEATDLRKTILKCSQFSLCAHQSAKSIRESMTDVRG
jgi:hypothetical protein